ncbi:MAG: hypothetical protein M1292_06525 [Bacteroidetes bacterium]|nr:hypothetical protein [Bacteroidota bacterium]
MDLNIICHGNLRELSSGELKSHNGGEITKSTSFFYDAVYSVFYLIGKSEILTLNFWEEWGYAVL